MKYLIIDDNEYDCKLLKYKLEAIDKSPKVDFSHTVDLAVERVKDDPPDIVFLDYELQNDNAFSFFEKLNMLKADVPRTVILTGVDRGENLDSLISLGAIDYFIKDDLNEGNLKILISRTMANYRKIKDFSFYKKIVDSSPEIKLILDKKGRILYANDSAGKSFGNDLIIGVNVEDILTKHPEGYFQINNSDQFYKIMPNKAWDDSLSTLTLLNVNDEINQQHKLEDKASKAINFSRMLVHDIKDNLGAGIQLAELITADLDKNDSKDLYFLQQSLRNCVSIIDSLAAISGIRETSFDIMIDLNYVLEEVTAAMKDKPLISMNCTDSVPGNYNILKTIFQNLLSNSVKHSSRNKSLKINIKTEISGENIIIHYRDNGEGIPEDLIETLFEDSVKGKHSSGMGLGLFIVKQALNILGGCITARQYDGGAYFEISLPAKPSR